MHRVERIAGQTCVFTPTPPPPNKFRENAQDKYLFAVNKQERM